MNPISQIRIQSIQVITLIISAVFLSLGVALIANYISGKLGVTANLLLTGIVLMLVSLFTIIKVINPKVIKTIRIKSGFFFDPEILLSRTVIGYKFNDDMGEYLKALGVENKAYAKALCKGYKDEDYDGEGFNPDKLDFYNLSSSAAEFIFLHQLDYHLNSYFVDKEINKSKIEVIPREDLPKSVLKNRVLELITRPHSEREAFYSDSEESDYELVYSVGDNGEIFHQVNLELPPESTVTRNENGFLEINNKIFKLVFIPSCNGCSTVVEPELIVGEYDSLWQMIMKIEVEIKKNLFLKQSELEIYEWLDSFLEKFEEYSSIKKLEERSNINIVRLLKS